MSEMVGQELRFAFGKNWARFLATVTAESIEEAEASLRKALNVTTLRGRRFLDAGCGSGLFSLAARRLGATVHSFDYDPDSVDCTRTLKAKFYPDDGSWVIERASVLDRDYLQRHSPFDVVYCWGVVHHTGQMWVALENMVSVVGERGTLVVAIYNDQDDISRAWLYVKKRYNLLPRLVRPLYVALVMLPFEVRSALFSIVTFRLMRYVRSWTHYRSQRGMSKWHDHVDWVGGLPFEVAKPEQVLRFARERGMQLVGLTTVGGRTGCNEFVLQRSQSPR